MVTMVTQMVNTIIMLQSEFLDVMETAMSKEDDVEYVSKFSYYLTYQYANGVIRGVIGVMVISVAIPGSQTNNVAGVTNNYHYLISFQPYFRCMRVAKSSPLPFV